jgi:serine/threonine-protein kinase
MGGDAASMAGFEAGAAFTVFSAQGSGCLSYGVEVDGRRWFVKRPTTPENARSLTRAVAVHAAVRHDAIVAPVRVLDGPTLIYPWRDGTILNHATTHGTDRSGLARFQTLPVADVHAALDVVLAAHRAVAAAGLVAVDLYDGCLLYDFDARAMWLVDLDEYRPGPFTVEVDRLPGSVRYMAPEELTRGATVDERTTVFNLGRVLYHLLDTPAGWRGGDARRAVVDRATRELPRDRFPDVATLVGAWRQGA